MNLIKEETKYGYKVKFSSNMPLAEYYYLFTDFIYQSNWIEGIHLNIIETVDEEDLPFDPKPEIYNHSQSLDYMLKNHGKRNITLVDHNKIHKLLMSSFLEDAGRYRKQKCWIGKFGCPLPKYIPKLMNTYIKKVNNLDFDTNLENLLRLHAEFETIHPRSDGNGREGRIAFNWLSLKCRDEFHVFLKRKVSNYYAYLRDFTIKFRKDHQDIEFNMDKL